jgi:hypothetical protein
MVKYLNLKNSWIYIIPGIVIVWSLFLLKLYGPFYLTRIDPDYIYLLNGLNCAQLDFIRIGHVDHPGTPFQILTGLFIRITYWIAGQGPIVDDVISRPEFYLSFLSFFLTLVTAGIILWLGKIVIKQEHNVIGILIIQSSLFVNMFLIDIPTRYIPDRMLAIMVLLYCGFCIKFFYKQDYSGKKFAVQSGVIMGIGFITKFNFLPLLIFPLFLVQKMKERIIYTLTLILTSVIAFLPVYDKFSYFKGFITSIIKHDGLYGGGVQQVINAELFWQNVELIFRQNLSFTIVFLLSFTAIVILLLKPAIRKDLRKEFYFFIALIFVTMIGILITAKHFKEYYIIPVISLTAFIAFVLMRVAQKIIAKRYINSVFLLFLLVFIYIPAAYLFKHYLDRPNYNFNNKLTSDFIEKYVSQKDYFLIEPSWLSGGMIENGMAYGLSYVAYRNYYYNEFERHYPNSLTWNGKDKPLQYLKMIDANNESLFKSGKNMFVFSTPGRNTELIYNYIDSCSRNFGIDYEIDTVYHNRSNNQSLIRMKNTSGWHIQTEARFGFERIINNTVFSDDEQYTLQGKANLSDKHASNGYYSLMLGENNTRSPGLLINNFTTGDYFELTVKRLRNDLEEKGNLFLVSISADGKISQIAQGNFVSVIHADWELIRLAVEIPKIPKDEILTCFYAYTGNSIEFIDDLTVKHFSKSHE